MLYPPRDSRAQKLIKFTPILRMDPDGRSRSDLPFHSCRHAPMLSKRRNKARGFGVGGPHNRRGVAAVEFAVVLPLLLILTFGAADFCRLFYYSIVVTDCATNGAIYLSNVTPSNQSCYGGVSQAALAEASDISPQPVVTSGAATDGDGNPAVTCTVSYTFTPVCKLFSPVNLKRTVQMRKY
jgi:Flp pilus assembly protein TadG